MPEKPQSPNYNFQSFQEDANCSPDELERIDLISSATCEEIAEVLQSTRSRNAQILLRFLSGEPSFIRRNFEAHLKSIDFPNPLSSILAHINETLLRKGFFLDHPTVKNARTTNADTQNCVWTVRSAIFEIFPEPPKELIDFHKEAQGKIAKLPASPLKESAQKLIGQYLGITLEELGEEPNEISKLLNPSDLHIEIRNGIAFLSFTNDKDKKSLAVPKKNRRAEKPEKPKSPRPRIAKLAITTPITERIYANRKKLSKDLLNLALYIAVESKGEAIYHAAIRKHFKFSYEKLRSNLITLENLLPTIGLELIAVTMEQRTYYKLEFRDCSFGSDETKAPLFQKSSPSPVMPSNSNSTKNSRTSTSRVT